MFKKTQIIPVAILTAGALVVPTAAFAGGKHKPKDEPQLVAVFHAGDVLWPAEGQELVKVFEGTHDVQDGVAWINRQSDYCGIFQIDAYQDTKKTWSKLLDGGRLFGPGNPYEAHTPGHIAGGTGDGYQWLVVEVECVEDPGVPLIPLEPATPIEPEIPLTPLEPATPVEPEGPAPNPGGIIDPEWEPAEPVGKPDKLPEDSTTDEVVTEKTTTDAPKPVVANPSFTG